EDGQVTLDATTQPGYTDRPVIIVWRNGSAGIDLKLGQTGLDGSYIVRGLALQGVGLLMNGNGNIVSHNWLGLTDDGLDIYYYNDNPNNRNNAIIEGAGGSGGHYIHHNVLAGSDTVAMDLEGDDILVEANWVGLNGDGTIDAAAIPEAIICDQTQPTDNWLGGGGINIAGYRNRVVDNVIAGLLIEGSATSTPPAAIDMGYGEYSLIAGNQIGVDAAGHPLWTCGDGVSDAGSDFTRILSNTIVNSYGFGLYMDGSYWETNGNTLQGNVISGCVGPLKFGDRVPDDLDLFHPALVTTMNGTDISGISDDPCPYCYVDVYLDNADAYVDALAYLGRAQADVNGDWSFSLPRALTANEGLRTISTSRNYGVIPHYEIGSSSKLSVLFTEQAPAGVSSVTLTPPTGDLWTGDALVFVANAGPANATLPITYTWTATGLPDQVVRGGVEKAVTFNWDAPGTKTVAVTATNAYGSASSSVEVVIHEHVALRGVSIDGPSTGHVGSPYDFDAVLDPLDASEPITYTWTPEPAGGQGAAQATYQWAVTGTHTITVTAENYGGLFTGTHTIAIAEASACVEVTGVDLSLLTSGTIYTNTTVQFSADIAPDDAGKPYTYTVDYGAGHGPATAGSEDPLQFNHVFAIPGIYTVEVGVWNCAMSLPHYDSVTFEVVGGSAPCVEVTGVAIQGPANVLVNSDATYNANVTPANASAPVTYIWSPAPFSGQNTNRATYRWGITGTQVITVSAMNCGMSVPVYGTRTISVNDSGGGEDYFIYLPLVMRDN
ncbi:MAG TPA: PKD domain-containing protein, partial [Anaerolineae bacterium]|nr:PKD domain-containing protein [Anaerolineae bacterium]